MILSIKISCTISEADERLGEQYAKINVDNKKYAIINLKNGKIVYENLPSKYKRSNTPAIPIDVPKFDMEELVAVHDLKDYGDSEEDIYRNLFTAGACRMEIQISDQKGNKSKKIYYLYISDKIDFGSTVERLPIAYEDYLKFWG